MATGDDALAAGMDILDGNEPANTIDTEINKSRDYIAQRTSAVTPVEKGGTGATTAEGARANLGVVLTDTTAGAGGKVPVYTAGGQIATAYPASSGHAANRAYVQEVAEATVAEAVAEAVPEARAGLVSLGYLNDRIAPGASVPIYSAGGAATSGYTIAYINCDGRLSRGASSERFKENIEALDPAELGDIWPEFSRFQMIGGDGTWKYGYIAERLAEHADQEQFVVYADINGEPVVASIDFIALVMAQNAQLHQAVELLAQRIATLEERTVS